MRVAVAVFLAGVLLGAGARADETAEEPAHVPTMAEDGKVLERCVIRERKAVENCIGMIASPCLREADSGGSETQCYGREGGAWLHLVDDYAGRILLHLDNADKKTEFAEAQQAWGDHRDKSCTFVYAFVEGSMAAPMAAACFRTENARRASDLMRLVDHVEDFMRPQPPRPAPKKDAGTPRKSAPPPKPSKSRPQ